MILKKSLYLSFCIVFISAFGISQASAQGRARIVKPTSSQLTSQPQNTIDRTKTTGSSQLTTQRPTLTNNIVVAKPTLPQPSLVAKTSSTQPTNIALVNNTSMMSSRLIYSEAFNQKLYTAIQGKLGIPYRYGSEGPNTYDCSAFVWKVFQESGIFFERSSARAYWSKFEPVYGADRYKFGTLVLLNGLGHIGIVADENGFYHASSSKGIMYSPFKGYWEKRVVGFRRVPVDTNKINLK
ncbi:MAG TPA: NlpC/P60 family protein [Pyrinomonadaceae bacterium]|jgi:cell wall-associated NlpC family hydrolase